MDIDLRLPSGEHLKEDEESNAIDNVLEHEEKLHNDNLLEHEEKLHNGDIDSEIVFDIRNEVHAEDGEDLNSPTTDVVMFNEDTILEPLFGMEFDSHGAAYSFYQEYARSMGFNTAIQNSRRSKTSREFIDAKFACSRYGTKREYEKPCTNKPRTRQSKQDASGRRSCSKTDCKASMHVKRRTDGKWVIHSFVKEHNHELLPAQAVSEQTRKMYAAMARQFAEYKNVAGLITDPKNPFDKGRNLSLEAGDLKILLDFFTQMQSENSNFFYAIDLGEDQRLKSLFWIDGKSRHDYINFNDVVAMDTTYIRNKYKMPLVLFVGVNQHYQFVLLGCALVSDESETTFSWLMQIWLKAVGGRSPKLIITDHDKSIKSVASDVFPNAHNCFCLWNILGKVSENLSHVVKRHENFVVSFEECIHRPCTNEEFERRWFEIVDEFELRENEWIQSLYEDRKQWVPTYMKDVCLAGMSVPQRSESVNSYFDKYVHKKTSVQEFLKQYEAILQDRYEEEAKADSDMWNKQPALKSPSPLEKSVSGMYTPSVFRKFQVEVLGAIGCTPKKETEDEISTTFRVHDCERNQDFTVAWNAMKLEISCLCCLFQYKGYLCRHALIVLQLHCGLSSIPPQYILNRWTKDAKSRHLAVEESDQDLSRVQKFDDLCQRAMKLIGEGSLSQESYSIVCSALSEAYGKCVDANCYSKSLIEPGTSASQGLPCIDEDNQNRGLGKGNKKKNPTKKRKVNAEPEVVMTVGPQDSSQQMDKLNPRAVNLDGYFGGQQGVQGMVQLNLMAPTRDNYYANTGIGQLNSMAPSHEGYFSAPQSMHGLGQMDFFRTNFTYNIRDDPNVRTATLHDDASRHA